jgi:hypothetical protein
MKNIRGRRLLDQLWEECMEAPDEMYRVAAGLMNDHRVPTQVRTQFFSELAYHGFDHSWCQASAARAARDPDVPDGEWASEGFESNLRRSGTLTAIARRLMRMQLGPAASDPIAVLRRYYPDLSEKTLAGVRQHFERHASSMPRG